MRERDGEAEIKDIDTETSRWLRRDTSRGRGTADPERHQRPTERWRQTQRHSQSRRRKESQPQRGAGTEATRETEAADGRGDAKSARGAGRSGRRRPRDDELSLVASGHGTVRGGEAKLLVKTRSPVHRVAISFSSA